MGATQTTDQRPQEECQGGESTEYHQGQRLEVDLYCSFEAPTRSLPFCRRIFDLPEVSRREFNLKITAGRRTQPAELRQRNWPSES